MTFLVIVLFLVICVSCLSGQPPVQDKEWEQYKMDFNKTYTPDEEQKRRSIWEENVIFVTNHNKEVEEGKYTFTCGINQYSDMVPEEFTDSYEDFLVEDETDILYENYVVTDDDNIPDYKNWDDEGKITAVKKEGKCAISRIFAVVGAVESFHAIQTNKLATLSEQQVLDCSDVTCHRNNMFVAFRYIEGNGIMSSARYAYVEKKERCKHHRKSKVATIGSFRRMGRHRDSSIYESVLQARVAMEGPVAVLIHFSFKPLINYKTGIFNHEGCKERPLTRGVLVVGYGTQEGQDYWIIKNSWGRLWGIGGYLHLERGINMCGIAKVGMYPLKKE